ncbi:MAG TPA: LCP family protein [Acidimicrobiales bacterium]|nr:LCP family protein [Acidimicrobiales bacterium]
MLIGLNIVVAGFLVVSGLSFGWVRYRVAAIPTQVAPDLTPTPTTGGTSPQAVQIKKQSSDGLTPENILLIGNETRAGLTNPNQIKQFGSPQQFSGSLSDVIMILHLDPKKRSASILSIPRDLFVPMPTGSPVGAYNKIDAALNDGKKGPDNLVRAITDDLGIPINHYVEVNFDGFEKTVEALGGIRLDFPERLYDAYSLLGISHTGCQLLGGGQALALVRSRHLQYDPPGVSVADRANWPYDPESDLARIVRDHIFVRVLIKTAETEGLANPLKLNRFLAALTDQVTMDPGLRSQIIRLALHYRNIAVGNIPETTLPVTQVGAPAGYDYDGSQMGDVEFPDQPADNKVIAAWDDTALPIPTKPESVQVLDATGTGLAARTGAGLRADGQHVTLESSTSVLGTPSETMVRYHPGQLSDGMAVAADFTGAVVLQSDTSVPSRSVRVDVGSVESVIVHHPRRPGSSSSPSSTVAHSTTTTVPTPGGQKASSAKDQLTPYDPRPCG